MVPTLDLLVQTAQARRRVGHTAPMVAVCSLEKDTVLEQLGVRSNTNAIQLALREGRGPVVVFGAFHRHSCTKQDQTAHQDQHLCPP